MRLLEKMHKTLEVCTALIKQCPVKTRTQSSGASYLLYREDHTAVVVLEQSQELCTGRLNTCECLLTFVLSVRQAQSPSLLLG